MKNADFRSLILYILGAGVVSAVISLILGLLFQGAVPDDLLSRSIFMGLFVGAGLYAWDKKKVPKKK